MVGPQSPIARYRVQKERWGLHVVKKPQVSLKQWTDQEWTTSDGTPSKGTKRYLPKAAWNALSPGEKAATNAAKAKGNAAGKQFVKQPKAIAKKVAGYR